MFGSEFESILYNGTECIRAEACDGWSQCPYLLKREECLCYTSCRSPLPCYLVCIFFARLKVLISQSLIGRLLAFSLEWLESC